jgi:hypothetical protein
MKALRLTAGIASLMILAPLTSAFAASDIIVGQDPCPRREGQCIAGFSPGGRLVRAFSYTPAHNGTLLVQFHGTMYCLVGNLARAVVDYVSQIVVGDRNLPATLENHRRCGMLTCLFLATPH